MRVAGMCQCEQWLSSAPTAQITLQREQADGEHGRGRRGSAGSEQGSGRAKIVSDRRPNTAETDLGVFSFSLAPSERDPAAVPSIQDFLGPTFLAKKKIQRKRESLGHQASSRNHPAVASLRWKGPCACPLLIRWSAGWRLQVLAGVSNRIIAGGQLRLLAFYSANPQATILS